MTETTDSTAWSRLEEVGSEAEGSMMVGFLETHGIPARIVDRSFHLTPAMDEDLAPIEIAVPTERLEEARAALAVRERDFAKTEGGTDALMTDEGLAEIDPDAPAENAGNG